MLQRCPIPESVPSLNYARRINKPIAYIIMKVFRHIKSQTRLLPTFAFSLAILKQVGLSFAQLTLATDGRTRRDGRQP